MDKSPARSAGSYIAMCIVRNWQKRGLDDRYGLPEARQMVAIHMQKRREYWRRVERGTRRLILGGPRFPDDDYAAPYSGIDSFWFRNTERNWREMHGKTPRPRGLS